MTINQAGAIAYRVGEDGRIELLLVRAKKNRHHWIVPKGHMEEGETEEQTAKRELQEEAGISGELVGYSGIRRFSFEDKNYSVSYYVYKFIKVVHEGEPGRDPQWCTVDEALNLITFADMKELIRGSLELIRDGEDSEGL